MSFGERNRVVFNQGGGVRLPAAGDLIGQKYRLDHPIALGGMGTVWRAHNETLGTPIAIKLVRSDAARSGASERLLTEARAAANLHHPAVVRVFDFGTAPNGDPFVVMELLSGETLRDVLERDGPMSAADAIRHILPILAGIDSAHCHGIVHRDIKPENIFLARDDDGKVQPKIVDFGIAKMTDASPRVTTSGTAIGSPEYMAPEQAAGQEDVDGRVDIWGAAVVLYEMIAGRTPWSAPNCPALLRAIMADEAPSLLGTPGVDAPLWAIIELALAKDREQRWKSARELGTVLACWLLAKGSMDDISGTSLKAAWPATQVSAIPIRRFVPSARARRTTRRRARRGRLRRVTRVQKAARWTAIGVIGAAVVLCVLAIRGERSETEVADQPVLAPEPTRALAANPPADSLPSEEPNAAESVEHRAAKSGQSARHLVTPSHPTASSSARAIPSAAPTTTRSARHMDFGI